MSGSFGVDLIIIGVGLILFKVVHIGVNLLLKVVVVRVFLGRWSFGMPTSF